MDALPDPVLRRSGYVDRARLAAAVHQVTDRFGAAVLAEPVRTRNLLFDEYGPAGQSQRRDVDAFAAALGAAGHSITVQSEPTEVTAQRVMVHAGLSADDATWTVELLRSIGPSGHGSSSGDPDATVVAGPPGRVPPGAPTASAVRWPRSARLAAIGLAAGLLATGGGAVLVAQRGNARTADWRERFEKASDQITELGASVGAGEATLQETIDELRARRDADAATIEGQQSELARMEADLAARDAAIARREADLAAMRTALEPISVGVDAVRPSTEPFSASGELIDCGFTNGCSNSTWTMAGGVLIEGGQVFLNVSDQAKIPITTADGFTFTGTAPIIGGYGWHTCNDVRIPTSMSIVLSPVRYSIDPEAGSVTVTVYHAVWTMSNEAGVSKCKAAARTYEGRVDFG